MLPQLSAYAWVHLKYTIPPALILTYISRPLFTRTDWSKVAHLVAIAVSTTIPWDSYLVKNGVWTYPPDAVLPGRIFEIPLEEVFFFFIQTYDTSLLYLLLSKYTFCPALLTPKFLYNEGSKPIENPRYRKYAKVYTAGAIACVASFCWSATKLSGTSHSTYLALILIWAVPFVLMLWRFSYQMLLALPLLNTVFPIMLPTLYLWLVDTLALQRGTWAIAEETKTGLFLWPGLEVEEALFFLLTNMMIVFGLVAFDNSLAIIQTFPQYFPPIKGFPSFPNLIAASLLPHDKYDPARVQGLSEAIKRLKRKSRSFYLASSTFEGNLRIDLVLLYSFCRAVDDLVDEAESLSEAKLHIDEINKFLDLSYEHQKSIGSLENVQHQLNQIVSKLPPCHRSAFTQLPVKNLPKKPLKSLLDGMQTDLEFNASSKIWPIKTDEDLEVYAYNVASTVAELCIHLVYLHSGSPIPRNFDQVTHNGQLMGQALQYINIARDVSTDAKISRVYLPLDWLQKEGGLKPEEVVASPGSAEVTLLRQRLLSKAMELYKDARPAIEMLPPSGRAPMRVAVESYVEIGRVLIKQGCRSKKPHEKATVPILRRLAVAWHAMSDG